VHLVARDGRTCARCGVRVADTDAPPYPERAHVVVHDGDYIFGRCRGWLRVEAGDCLCLG